MSSNNRPMQVKMVRIQHLGKPSPITHQSDVTVVIVKDPESNGAYLRITVNGKAILSEELKNFQWLDQSCVDGVVTIESSIMKIIIIYDAKYKELREFVAEMKTIIKQKPLQEPSPRPVPQEPPQEPSVRPVRQEPLQEPPVRPVRREPPQEPPARPVTQEQTKLAIHDLVRHIENGSTDELGYPTKCLAKSGANVQFTLASRLDNGDKENSTKQSTTRSSPNALQLRLQIECHLNREPIVETIYVRYNTTLRELKELIQTETGIERKDQYWYAFERYLISDDYEFGSKGPVVPPLPRNAPRNSEQPPTDPIRSGDTIIMYIAQMPPIK